MRLSACVGVYWLSAVNQSLVLDVCQTSWSSTLTVLAGNSWLFGKVYELQQQVLYTEHQTLVEY